MTRAARFAALASAALSSLAAACELDGAEPATRLVDESSGRFGGVGLGSSEAEVRRVFGEPGEGDGYFPLGERYRGPPSVSFTGYEPPVVLRYDDAAFLLVDGVFSLMTTDEGATTRRGVGVGDPLARVRERYARVRCGTAPAGEGVFGSDDAYPWCRTRVGDVDVFFGDDPIESVTLTRVQSDGGTP